MIFRIVSNNLKAYSIAIAVLLVTGSALALYGLYAIRSIPLFSPTLQGPLWAKMEPGFAKPVGIDIESTSIGIILFSNPQFVSGLEPHYFSDTFQWRMFDYSAIGQTETYAVPLGMLLSNHPNGEYRPFLEFVNTPSISGRIPSKAGLKTLITAGSIAVSLALTGSIPSVIIWRRRARNLCVYCTYSREGLVQNNVGQVLCPECGYWS